MPWRFCVSSPTILARAVWARPRNSSSGSSPIHGRCGKATLTRIARSRCTVMSVRVSFKSVLQKTLSKQRLRQQLVEMIPARLALDAEAARVVRTALQAALHFLAYAPVLELDLMRHRDALGVEAPRFLRRHVRE